MTSEEEKEQEEVNSKNEELQPTKDKLDEELLVPAPEQVEKQTASQKLQEEINKKKNELEMLETQRAEAEAELISWHKKRLQELEEDLANQREEGLNQIKKDLMDEKTEQVIALQGEMNNKRKDLLDTLLNDIEAELKQHRLQLKSEREEERTKLKAEIKTQNEACQKEFADARKKLNAEIKTQNEECQKECADARKKLKGEIKTQNETCQKECDEARAARETEKTSLKKETRELNQLRAEVQSESNKNDYRESMLEANEKAYLKNRKVFDKHLDIRVQERKKAFDKQEEVLGAENERLRESLALSTESIGTYEELKRRLGGEDPRAVLLKLNEQEKELNKLQLELLEPTEEMLGTLNQLEKRKNQLEAELESANEELESHRANASKVDGHKFKILELSRLNASLKNQVQSLGAECGRLQQDLERFHAAYKRTEEREDRIRDVERVYLENPPPLTSKIPDEQEWLSGIQQSCNDYGLYFPKRILYSFHTALKTAEWSPLTVLSGVSGTGKSQLPELYAHFGGLNFLSLAVQPNWDSQESMLGFFNSIDNKFDAQPVLRLLAQTQKTREEDYPGLKDAMTIVLMDEMNLAHVELYFADFLSKLELRRGSKGEEVPKLEVKLGAGIEPYQLPLGRNVLWAGTTNQDETTKSLSDKVIDRGIIIHFPRPLQLERRKELKPKGTPSDLLPRKTWEEWWARKVTFSPELIKDYKEFVEDMNKSLAKVGRAIGHRVWQSIEYYMQNYPTVQAAQKGGQESDLKKAMDTAFEDQLVQKIMPKLMGIETRSGSVSRKCLDSIKVQLGDEKRNLNNLIPDFDSACEFGHGVFLWNSAGYLHEDREEPDLKKTPSDHEIEIKKDKVAEGAEEEEKTEFDVILTEMGSDKISLIIEVRSIAKIGLVAAKELVESAPNPIKEGIPKEEAEEIRKKLEAAGGKAEIK